MILLSWLLTKKQINVFYKMLNYSFKKRFATCFKDFALSVYFAYFCHCRTPLSPAQHHHPDQRHHPHSPVEWASGQRWQNRPELLRQVLCVQVTQRAMPLLWRQCQLPAWAARPDGSQVGGMGPAASNHVRIHNPGSQRGVAAQRQGPCQRKCQHHHKPRW